MRESEKRGQWQDDGGGKWKKVKPKGPEKALAPKKQAPAPAPAPATRALVPVQRKVAPAEAPNKPAEKRKAVPAEVPIEELVPKSKVKPKAALAIKDEEPETQKVKKGPIGKFNKKRAPQAQRKEDLPGQIEPYEGGRMKKFIKRSAELGKVAKNAMAAIAQKSLNAVLAQARQGVGFSATTPQAAVFAEMGRHFVRRLSQGRRTRRFKTPALKGRRDGK